MATIPLPRLSSHFDLQDARFSSLVFETINIPAGMVTAPAGVTLTPAQLLSGFISRSGPTGPVTDTLPSAAALCAAIQGVMVNLSFACRFRNSSGGIVTLQPGAGGTTAPGNVLTAAATSGERMIRIVFTNVTIGQEAYTVYSLGAGTWNA